MLWLWWCSGTRCCMRGTPCAMARCSRSATPLQHHMPLLDLAHRLLCVACLVAGGAAWVVACMLTHAPWQSFQVSITWPLCMRQVRQFEIAFSGTGNIQEVPSVPTRGLSWYHGLCWRHPGWQCSTCNTCGHGQAYRPAIQRL